MWQWAAATVALTRNHFADATSNGNPDRQNKKGKRYSIVCQNNTTIIGIIVAVFLVGIGVGDILSKTKQTNTHYASLISYPNGQE
jgi:hypothetical protein